MEKNYDTHEVSEELVEAVHQALVNDPDRGNVEEGNDPTPPEVYVETDPSEKVVVVRPGDPGTYTGDYAPVYKESVDREELPAKAVVTDEQGEIRP